MDGWMDVFAALRIKSPLILYITMMFPRDKTHLRNEYRHCVLVGDVICPEPLSPYHYHT